MTTQEQSLEYSDLNKLAQRVHKANIKWWQDPITKLPVQRNKGELLMLVITELAEACEGERKNLMDDKLPHRRMAEVEMADALIRLLDFAAGFNYILYSHIIESLIPDNKGEALYCLCRVITNTLYSIYGNPPDVGLSIAIAAIREYCKVYNYDLWGAFEEKMRYNETREDHKHESRLQAGGKKW